MSTYNRKYYLHRQVKKAGFCLMPGRVLKTIEVPQCEVERAAGNKYVAELRERYQYGCQIINPMIQ